MRREDHRSGDTNWLRAAVLGSNDAIVSTASLMVGFAASNASTQAILLAGSAGLVAGAMSMGVGEYVSVSSQRDAEEADIGRETRELAEDPKTELQELAGIYAARGLAGRDGAAGCDGGGEVKQRVVWKHGSIQ